MRVDTKLLTASIAATLYEKRQTDYIDLVSPFVYYCIADSYEIGEKIDLKKLTIRLNEHFQLDIHEAVVEKILIRSTNHNKEIILSNKNFIYNTSFDEIKDKIDFKKINQENH